MEWILVAAGLAALVGGGHLLVSGAVGLARALGVPPLVIGLTLVGFGTSAPELVTSLEAARIGADAVAIGNVVGSNIANVLLILGLAALVAPIAVDRRAFRRDGTALALVTLAGVAVLADGAVARWEGIALLGFLAAYLVATFVSGGPAEDAADGLGMPSPWLGAGSAVAGLVLVVLGARWLVSGSVEIAQDLGLSEALIGLTLVAVGTSLPELVTSVIAARRGQSAIALGNVLGSNVFNLAGILGLTAAIAPLTQETGGLGLDLAAMAGAAALLIAASVTGWRVTRREGALCLALYVAYVAGRAAIG